MISRSIVIISNIRGSYSFILSVGNLFTTKLIEGIAYLSGNLKLSTIFE